MLGGVRDLCEDVGSGVAAGVAAVLAAALGVVLTLHLTGGTPYSQDDLDRANRVAAVQAQESTAPAPVAPTTTGPDVAAVERDLATGRERIRDLEKRVVALRTANTTAERTITRLQRRLAALRDAQDAEAAVVDPITGLPTTPAVPGTGADPADPDAPEATEVTVSGALRTTWTLTEAAKPWPQKCGMAYESYAVRVLGAQGGEVTTGAVTGATLVERTVRRGVLTLVCDLDYRAVLPLPAQAVYEFQAVDRDRPRTSLYSAVVQGPVVTAGAGPRLALACTDCA